MLEIARIILGIVMIGLMILGTKHLAEILYKYFYDKKRDKYGS